MSVLRRLWPYYRPGWPMALLSLLLVLLGVCLGLMQPQIIRWVVDLVLQQGAWDWLLPGAAAVVLAAVLQGACRYGQRYTMELVAQQVIYALRSELYRHLQSLSFRFYDRVQTGELISRVTADVDTLRQAASVGMVNGLMNLLTIGGIVVAMLLMDWRLALVSLLFLPPMVMAVFYYATRSRATWSQVQQETARLTAAVQENLAGVRVVRAFAQEEAQVERFEQVNRAFREANLRAVRLNSFWTTTINFLAALGSVIVLWYGGHRAIEGAISLGTLVAFNTYLANLIHPVRMMGWITSMMARARAGLQRIFELLDTRPEVQEKPGAVAVGRLSGHVVLEDVSFSYDGVHKVLDHVSLEILPGQRVAILGLTGSGKSSLVQLLPRFYDPDAGRVLIDGMDVRDMTLESLRRNIAVVPQEPFLFSTTLRENIAYGRPDATMAEVVAAAKAAQIHEFIESLPDGYETVVGERGVDLSGGQKQRVAIARALLMDSPILILDEFTSAVDVQTEAAIRRALQRLMAGRTCLIIASRLSTVQEADLVVVMDRGRIVQQGTPAELSRQEGLYREICRLQLQTGAGKEGAVI
ncbi:MAG TPA: ABC transporter ATP-binding protein [Symbiobacteriaceae bacterium]